MLGARPPEDPTVTSPIDRSDPDALLSEGTAERVLVCVGPAPGSALIVRAGQRIAAGLRAPWFAAAVEATSLPPLPEADRDRLEAHLRLAESLGADVVRLSGLHVPDAVLDFARKKNVSWIVLGKPRDTRWRDRLHGSLVDEIIRGSGEIEVHVLSGSTDAGPARAAPGRREGRTPALEYVRAVAVMGVTTALAAATRALFHVPDVEMLFLLGVMIVALTSGRRASILAAALAVACYDFFFVPPAYTLDVSDARYFLTFAMMLGIGVVIGTLTLRVREQQRAAVARERRTSAVYALSRELAAAVDAAGVGAACVRAVAEAFECEAVFLTAKDRAALEAVAAAPPGLSLGAGEHAVAQWVLEHGRPAGGGTETLPGEPVLCLPLRTWGDVLAVMALRSPGNRSFSGDQRDLLESLGRHAAVALDRVRLAEEARRAALRARTEELRSALLSAVSHDLRTPLAAITGAGTLLLDDGVADPALRKELTTTVVEEAERLERLVANLLDMTRLESGVVEPKREWVPLVEVVGVAMNRLDREFAGRDVAITIPDDLPLLSIDSILVQQLFVNLLENATKYTPSGSEITVRASREGGTLVVDVADRGPGIPSGEEERVFERFHRAAQPGVHGVGLGLPIARAIAQAHGGRLTASNRPDGGAVFRLTLPVGTPPGAAPEPAPEHAQARGAEP
jgi:two-component system, OmpR family, sensor histidine kinase KdpD